MAVDGVNSSNSNTGLYTGSAAVVGGGAGAAYGYLSKPFLKNNEPTDSFIKEMGKKIVNVKPPEGSVDSLNDLIKNTSEAKTVEELKEGVMKSVKATFEKMDVDTVKVSLTIGSKVAEGVGEKGFTPEEIDAIKNIDDVLNLFSKNFDEKYAGKTLEQIREMSNSATEKLVKNSAQNLFTQLWDHNTKSFAKVESDGTPFGDYIVNLRKAVVDAANSIKVKTALLYGGIGAAVLGLGTLVACLASQKPENVPADADMVEDVKDLKNEEV